MNHDELALSSVTPGENQTEYLTFVLCTNWEGSNSSQNSALSQEEFDSSATRVTCAREPLLQQRASYYFQSLASGVWSEKAGGEIIIKYDTKPTNFERILQFILKYGSTPATKEPRGREFLDTESVLSLCMDAVFFGCDELRDACIKYMMEHAITFRNVCEYWTVASSHGLESVAAYCKAIFLDHFPRIYKTPAFLRLPQELLRSALQSDYLNCRKEEHVWRALLLWGIARYTATSTEAPGSADVGGGLVLPPPDSKKGDEAGEKEKEVDNKVASSAPSSEEPIEGVKSKEETVEETLARYSTEYRKTTQQPPQQQPDSPPISFEEEAKKGFRQWERSATKRQWVRFGKAPPQEAKPKKAPTVPPLLWVGKSEKENAVMREILGELISLVRYPTIPEDILFVSVIPSQLVPQELLNEAFKLRLTPQLVKTRSFRTKRRRPKLNQAESSTATVRDCLPKESGDMAFLQEVLRWLFDARPRFLTQQQLANAIEDMIGKKTLKAVFNWLDADMILHHLKEKGGVSIGTSPTAGDHDGASASAAVASPPVTYHLWGSKADEDDDEETPFKPPQFTTASAALNVILEDVWLWLRDHPGRPATEAALLRRIEKYLTQKRVQNTFALDPEMLVALLRIDGWLIQNAEADTKPHLSGYYSRTHDVVFDHAAHPRHLVCVECKSDFTLDTDSLQWYFDKYYKLPKRCGACKSKQKKQPANSKKNWVKRSTVVKPRPYSSRRFKEDADDEDASSSRRRYVGWEDDYCERRPYEYGMNREDYERRKDNLSTRYDGRREERDHERREEDYPPSQSRYSERRRNNSSYAEPRRHDDVYDRDRDDYDPEGWRVIRYRGEANEPPARRPDDRRDRDDSGRRHPYPPSSRSNYYD